MNLFFFVQKTVFSTKFSYSLKNSVILDLSSMIHVFNKIIQFLNFWFAQFDDFFWAGDHKVSIQSYDNINIEIQCSNDKIQSSIDKKLMKFQNVVFCKNFAVNLMSFWQFHKLSYWWDNRSEFNHICKINCNYITVITFMKLHEQNMLKHIFIDSLIKTSFYN